MTDKLTRSAFQAHLESMNDFDVTIDLDATKTYSRRASDTEVASGPTLAAALPHLAIATESRAATNPELEILGKLGEGGMAIVQLASQVSLGREVAVKTPKPDSSSPRDAETLLHEALVTGRLEHPNIVPVYLLGSDDAGTPQIVMKRIEGTSWEEVVGDRRLADDPAELTHHIEILLQVCSAVRFAHDRGIIHRDIKPGNVMIGDFDEVYLLDWGLAVAVHDDPLVTRRADARGMCGTPAFMAPEMTDNDASNIDERTDVYLLGATLHWLLTGEHRHRGEVLFEVLLSAWKSEPHEYPAEVPEELAEIANRACARDKGDRYPSVDAFREALDGYLEHRESIVLSNETDRRRQDLVELLARHERTADDERALHDVFGECRFGYAQALRMWPDNEPARDGLQAVLEAMAEHYLDGENVAAAEACLAQLPTPNPDLTARCVSLAEELKAEGRDIERLREFQADMDASRGTVSRSLLAVVFGSFWTFSTFRTAWREWNSDVAHQLAREAHFHSGVRNLILVIVLLFIFRKRLFVNRLNAILMYVVGTLFATEFVIRSATYYLEAPIHFARTVDELLFGFTTVVVGLLTDRRLIFISSFFFTSAIVSIFFPSLQLWAMGTSTFLVFSSAAWIWRRQDDA